MGLYEKSNIIYNTELNKLRHEINENKRKISELTDSLIEYKKYLTINPKTGLPNHKVFVKDLEKLIKKRNLDSSAPFGLLFIDLYKSMAKIEYSLASCLSDAILARICLEVKEVLETIFNRPLHPDRRDVILSMAPLEGKEYSIYHSERNEELMVIIRNIRDGGLCHTIAKTIYDKITEPKELEFNNDIIHLTCHIAAALYPESGTIKEELLSNTDIALQYAIEKNKKISFYTVELGKRIREKKTLESDMSKVLDKKNIQLANNCFELHFQPLINPDYTISGAEALLRWNHPDKGLLMPGSFIDLAEETGFIVPLGYIVLEKACQYLKHWKDTGLLHDDFFLSINLSPKQFKQHDLVEKFDSILKKYKISSKYIRIEITEIAYFENPDLAARKIEILADRGIKIIIDDCGAPGNAIYNLRKLPEELLNKGYISTLKLDKSLIDSIHRLRDRVFFKHNLEMAWQLHFDVVIEGIETANQEKILKEIEEEIKQDNLEINIKRQGFLFSKPVKETEFLELLKKHIFTPL